MFNVIDFGATNDGTSDSTPGIQAAIDAAAAAGGGTVVFPRGRYAVSKPLRVRSSNIRLLGDGRDRTTLTPQIAPGGLGKWVGPLLAVGPTYNNITTTTSLKTGPGAAMVASSSVTSPWFDLGPAIGRYINDATDLTLEMFLKLDSIPSAQVATLVWSYGSVGSDQTTPSIAIALSVWSDGKLHASLTVDGTTFNFAGATTLTTGTVHHVVLAFDGNPGTNTFVAKIGLDGTWDASVSGSGSKITRKPWENLAIFRGALAFPNWAFDYGAPDGAIDSLRISDTVRYSLSGSTYTAPTAKHSVDGNTILLLNFDNLVEHYVVGQCGVSSLTRNVWLPVHITQGAQIGNVTLEGMSFEHGGGATYGPHLWDTFDSSVRDVNVNYAHYGLTTFGSCYQNRYERINTQVYGGVTGIQISGAAGATAIRDCAISGGAFPLVMVDAAAVISSLIIEVTPETLYGVLAHSSNGAAVALFEGCSFEDENNTGSASKLVSMIHSDGMGSLKLSACSFGEYDGTYSPAPIAVRILGGDSHILDGCSFSLLSGAASVIDVPTANPPAVKVAILHSTRSPSTVPWYGSGQSANVVVYP